MDYDPLAPVPQWSKSLMYQATAPSVAFHLTLDVRVMDAGQVMVAQSAISDIKERLDKAVSEIQAAFETAHGTGVPLDGLA